MSSLKRKKKKDQTIFKQLKCTQVFVELIYRSLNGQKNKTFTFQGILIWAGHRKNFLQFDGNGLCGHLRATQPWRKEADGERCSLFLAKNL